MELAHLSGFAVFAGSVVVALGTLASAWLTKKHEARARRASENKVGRQKLYAQIHRGGIEAVYGRPRA